MTVMFRSLLVAAALTTAIVPAFGQQPAAPQPATPPAAPQTDPNPTLTEERRTEIINGMRRVMTTNAFVPGKDFSNFDEFLEKYKDEIAAAKTDSELAEAINSRLMRFYGVSHVVLITPQAMRARTERRAVGVGIQVAPEEGGIRILGVFPGSPAAEAGLLPGDLILEADGKKVDNPTQISGAEGTQVVLTIKREDGTVKNFTLTRRAFSNVRPDTLTWVNDNTAVLKVHTFDLSYDRRRIDELMAEASKAENLILDLRSNGGGVVANMLHLLGHLLSPDMRFGTFISRGMVDEFVKETKGDPTDLRAIVQWSGNRGLAAFRRNGQPFAGRIAVLVNGGTGSAAEITAAALKEFRDASVVGTRSAGGVLVSTMAPLTNGWFLQFPFMDYVTARGVRLEGNGVTPDVEAPTPRFNEPDVAVERALALLHRQALRQERSTAPSKPDGQ